ncbi:DUF1579 domain-containing protein [Tistrella mobilis]|uniref:DUF1579 domain-containing protein n=1 Tax=Tistrella mobilis TaxID=171437 RepID=UPI00355924BD
MHTDPAPEHAWLRHLIGRWRYTADCLMGPDQPRQTFTGTETARMLGDFWLIAEGEGEMPDGDTGRSLLTIGFDPARGGYTGTWVGSMMTRLWVYEGRMDESGRELTLAAEGPDFSGTGMALYHDIHRIESEDRRLVVSKVRMPDGSWQEFMTAVYTRISA